MASANLGHQLNVASIDIVSSLKPLHYWNEFDEHGSLVSLPRLRGEKNWEYKRRILDTMVHIANSSYRGLVHGITRELGLSLEAPLQINPKTALDGTFLAPDPYIKFHGAFLYLYSDYANSILDFRIDRFEPGSDYEQIGNLIDFINTTSFFEASLISPSDSSRRSMTILNQSNRESVEFERLKASSKFKLENQNVVPGSVFFSNRSVFQTEVSQENQVVSTGQYFVDYSKGIIVVFTIPAISQFVRYQYTAYPFAPLASPVILHDINSESFKVKMFEQILLDNGAFGHGLPTGLGIDIIDELLQVKPMYWGI